MGDNQSDDSITYSIKFRAIRIDFVINDDSGYMFLKEMLRLKRMSLFNTPYMMLLTQFLYKNYSKRIMKMLLPSYLVHQVSMLTYVLLSEHIRDHTKKALEITAELGVSTVFVPQKTASDLSTVMTFRIILKYIMIGCSFVNIYFLYNQIRNIRWKILTRMWSWVDFLIIVLNLTIIVNA